MKVRKWKGLWGSLAIVFPALAVLVSQTPSNAFAGDDVEITEGKVTELSPDRGNRAGVVDEHVEEAEVQAPRYWIGLQGRPIDNRLLRTQLQLAADVGVAIETVMPDSPAEKAGLRQDDILVAVDGEPLADLAYLQSVVAEKHDKPVELKILRLAKEEIIEVTPERIPAEVLARLAVQQQPPGLMGMMPGRDLDPRALMEQLRRQGGLGGMRMIGPGMIFGGAADGGVQVPHGVSVNVSRRGDGPATITVQKGDDSWTVEGDDDDAIAQLPEEVRPFVEQILSRGESTFGAMPHFVPGDLRQFDAGGGVDPLDRMNQRMLQRMERLEQRLRELQQERGAAPAPNAAGEADPGA